MIAGTVMFIVSFSIMIVSDAGHTNREDTPVIISHFQRAVDMPVNVHVFVVIGDKNESSASSAKSALDV